MPSKNNKTHRIPIGATKPKRSRRITTVEDLLARDDVNGILNNLNEVKPNISDLIVIYMDKRDKQRYFLTTEGTLVSTATWLLETTKYDIILEDDEE